GQAQNRLGQGQARAAGEAMEQASDALSQASQQLGQSRPAQAANRQPAGQPGGNVGTARGAPDLSLFPEEARKYAGKPWGELPGELRTRIVQDLRARYGEDYARVIKYYFEQLAERK
ncbi:MAG TPA: hypothetical protein VIL46_16235, partial [Gemmataceae bacterium]